jgi:DNA-binding GntR family transcriptional regulator
MTMASSDPDMADPRAYRRLAALIRQQIGDGTLHQGRPAPSITSLSKEHGYARQTCSKALRILEDEGLVAQIPGLGYYVN